MSTIIAGVLLFDYNNKLFILLFDLSGSEQYQLIRQHTLNSSG